MFVGNERKGGNIDRIFRLEKSKSRKRGHKKKLLFSNFLKVYLPVVDTSHRVREILGGTSTSSNIYKILQV